MKTNLVIAVLLIAVVAIPITIWRKFYRDLPQPQWITANQRNTFFYGAVGAEETQGIPYWIWLALPRMFPEYMPAPGGYASLGLSWEETLEMPVGFAKKTIGYVRATGNCGLCHAASYTSGQDEIPTVIVAAPGHSTNIQPLLTFLSQCAQDPRFNANEILAEVDNATKLSLVDRLLYRYVLIPRTKTALASPAKVIFARSLRDHAENPQAAFSEQRMKELQAWMNAQRH
jgi:cytochrome c553